MLKANHPQTEILVGIQWTLNDSVAEKKTNYLLLFSELHRPFTQ